MSEDAVQPLVVGLAPFTCPACAHTSPYGNARGEVLRCSECTSRIAFGRAMPRVVVQPCEDRRFVQITFSTWDEASNDWKAAYTTTVDKDYGQAIWHNVQSICR